MAWINPKTNWAAADGVRNTDLNRIEANTLELYNTLALRYSLTVNVATTGNDTTGNGSSSAPYRTITKALSVIPKTINGYTALISITPGTYNETVIIQDFNGLVTLASTGTVTINALNITRCTVLLNITNLVIMQSASITYNAALTSLGNITTNSLVGLSVTDCSRANISTLTANNAGVAGVSAFSASLVHIKTFAGTGSNIGLFANSGSIISFESFTATVTGTRYSTNNGGRIYTGSQLSAPSY